MPISYPHSLTPCEVTKAMSGQNKERFPLMIAYRLNKLIYWTAHSRFIVCSIYIALVKMEKKSDTKLFLVEKSPPIFTSCGKQGFTGSFPLTEEDILLQFFGYHRYLQKNSKLQSSSQDAIRLVIQDVNDWWSNSGIPLKSWQAIEQFILKIIEDFKNKLKNKNRNTEAVIKKEMSFLLKIKQTFWVVQPSYENDLQRLYTTGKSTERNVYDWLYLEGVRGMQHTATLGSFDKKLAKRKKRSFDDRQAHEARKSKLSTSANPCNNSYDNEESDSDDNETSSYTPPVIRPPPKNKKKEGIPESVYLISDKKKVSNRTTTELAAAFLRFEGKNLDEYNLSVNTTRRRRNIVRVEKAEEIIQCQLRDCEDNIFALHWDGKIIKSLTHVGNDIDRVAVLLTRTDGQEILLSIVGIEGPSTASNEAKHIIQVSKTTTLLSYFKFLIYKQL